MISLEVDRASLDKLEKRLVTEILKATKGSVRDAARRLEKDLEAVTRAAVPGRMWRMWESYAYPRGEKLSYEPVGVVRPKGGRRTQGMTRYWTTPGINRAGRGQWLAIPTQAAGPKPRDGNLTPGEWERRNGVRLEFVYRENHRYAWLVASGAMARNQSGQLRTMTPRRAGQGRQRVTVPIFILIPEQLHANSVPVLPAINRAKTYMVESFRRRLRAGVNRQQQAFDAG